MQVVDFSDTMVAMQKGMRQRWPFGRAKRRGESMASSQPLIWSRLFSSLGDEAEQSAIGLNELHTMLRDAVQKEDYVQAGQISDIVLHRLYGDDNGVSDEETRSRRRRMSWKGLGAAPWLAERLDALNFTLYGQPGTSTSIGLRSSFMGWNCSSISRFFVSKRMMP